MHLTLLTILLGLLAGIIISKKGSYGSEVAIVSIVLGCIQFCIHWYRSRVINETSNQVIHKNHFSIPLVSGIFFMFVFVGILRVQLETEKAMFLCNTKCSFGAVVKQTPVIKGTYQLLVVAPEVDDDVYNIQIRAPLYPRYLSGDRVRLSGTVTAQNNIAPHENKKSFDYVTYMRSQGVGSEMFFPHITFIEEKKTARIYLQRVKDYCVMIIARHTDEPSNALASGMLFGVTSMSKELVQTFRVSGLSHIIVLSGFNIAVLISFVLFVFAVVPLLLRVICAGIFVVLFVIAVDGEASVIRATVMSCIGLLALLLGREYTARTALLFSLFGIVMYTSSNALYDVSLHLSFLATAGIVYMNEGIETLLVKIQSRSYKEIIVTTFSAYIATLPYVLFTFGSMSVYALITNFIVLPLVPVMMIVSFLIIPMSFISETITTFIGFINTYLGAGIIGVARFVERLPFSSVTVYISFSTMCALYGALIIGYVIIRNIKKVSKNETSLTKDGEILSDVISY